MSPKIARLAGLGAFAACAFFVLLYAYVVWLVSPSSTGGIMWPHSVLAYIALALVTFSLILVHVAIGKQLLYIADGGGPRPV